MMAPFNILWYWVVLLSLSYSAELVSGQQQEDSICYGPGSIAASVILTSIFTVLLGIGLYLLLQRYRRKQREHLILETADPEKGKADYAFDNPGFKDTSLTPAAHKLDNNHKKWTQWPLAALSTKSEKKKTLDDSAIDTNEVKVVALRSHDFTGLGFNICGNMKEGIFIKDVLHRGPASESGKLNPGDRLNSLTISFEHMVYEDALTILSYASPYEVIIEAKGGKIVQQGNAQGSSSLSHPVYRSTSCTDLLQAEKLAKKRLFADESFGSNYSSLQKSRSNMTTLERKESQSPTTRPSNNKKPAPRAATAAAAAAMTQLSPNQLKNQLEQKILADHHNNLKIKQQQPTTTTNVEIQKSENKYQKFGIRVLPEQQKSPKSNEQNDNNVNIEKGFDSGIDEVDKNNIPQAKKREKKPENLITNNEFVRENSLNGSGIKRDKNGIPQEIPNYMMNAAVAARSNRKNSDGSKDDTPTKKKGKAPAPPEPKSGLDEIQLVSDEILDFTPREEEKSLQEEIEVELRSKENQQQQQMKNYNSDSDVEEGDNQSSVNTIELNASDITIHHSDDNNDIDKQNRRTASTGDLTKIQRNQRSNNGTLERAQSLDITDAGITTLTKKRKGSRLEDVMKSDEDLFGKVMISKEPRLSLILDGLNTFQRNRLKKSTEWGNLEDAILKLNQENGEIENDNDDNEYSFRNSKEIDALVDKINEIKRESFELSSPPPPPTPVKCKTKNQIWPFEQNEKSNDNNLPVIVQQETKSRLEIHDDNDNENLSKAFNKSRLEVSDHDIENFNKSRLEDHENLNKAFIQSRFEVSDKENENFSKSSNTSRLEISDYDNENLTKALNKCRLEVSDHDNENTDKPIIKSRLEIEEPKQENSKLSEGVEVKKEEKPNKIVLEAEPIIKIDAERYEKRQQKPLKYEHIPPPISPTFSDDLPEYQSVIEQVPDDEYPMIYLNVSDITKDFLFTEKLTCSNDVDNMKQFKETPTKSINISNVTVNECNNTSLEQDLYTTALDKTVKDDTKVTVSTVPEMVNNSSIGNGGHSDESIDVTIQGPTSLTLEIPQEAIKVTENKKYSVDLTKIDDSSSSSSPKSTSLTYITEIQVATPPTATTTTANNVSEIEIVPNLNGRNLDNDFENFVKNFESQTTSNTNKYDNDNKNDITNTNSLIINNETLDAEKELHKIQEIADEQLKKLPEMRFTTSSYESKPTIEKRPNQIELLRSNFEKNSSLPPQSPPNNKNTKSEVKSRIPIATTTKTPPTSPERRDSRNLDMENDKAILELMSSNSVHSTPKYQLKSNNKNVTVTSIRTNSKIPSGLPILSTTTRPPIPPRRQDSGSNDDHQVHVTTTTTTPNGGVESNSFKQWVFNPSENSVTNITVTENKTHQQHHK